MNRHRKPSKILFFILVFFAFLAGINFILMSLWNNILVAVLHVGAINFWQSLGILALSKILFGFPGKPGWRGRGRWRQQMEGMREKFMNMTPEERAKFKEDWGNRGRCGRWQRPASAEATATE